MSIKKVYGIGILKMGDFLQKKVFLIFEFIENNIHLDIQTSFVFIFLTHRSKEMKKKT